jgi:hypothetical protein
VREYIIIWRASLKGAWVQQKGSGFMDTYSSPDVAKEVAELLLREGTYSFTGYVIYEISEVKFNSSST